MDRLAEEIGLVGYATTQSGIGGVLKARVSDFRVDEIATPIHLDPKGRFTVAKVSLTNWETNRFCQRLASILRIPRNRIFFAGTKDKRAVTSQLFVIDAPQHKVAAVELADVEIEVLGRTHQKLGLGNHRGNRFTIVVRGCCDENGHPLSEVEALEQVERIRDQLAETLGAGLFPNWIGPQRFGSGRPVTATVGYHVLRGEWEEAVMAYLSLEGDGEEAEAREIRRKIRVEGISQDLIDSLPRWMGYERRLMEHLLDHPVDHVGAFRQLPANLQLMTVHAIQSIVFNKTIQARLERGMPLSTPIEGDFVARIDERGQMDASAFIPVGGKGLDRIVRNCKLGRLVTTGPLPGSEIQCSEGEPGRLEAKVMSESKLDDVNWTVEAIPRLTTLGTRRSLVSGFNEFLVDSVPIVDLQSWSQHYHDGPQEGERWHPEGACIRFRFTLTSGSYATTLLREFLHVPLAQLS